MNGSTQGNSGPYHKTLLMLKSAISKGQRRGASGPNEWFFRLMIQKGQTTMSVVKLMLEMPTTQTPYLICVVGQQNVL